MDSVSVDSVSTSPSSSEGDALQEFSELSLWPHVLLPPGVRAVLPPVAPGQWAGGAALISHCHVKPPKNPGAWGGFASGVHE